MCGKLFKVNMIGALVIVLVLITAGGLAEEEKTDANGQWKYVLGSGGATITGYVEEPSGDLVIPGELDGFLVKAIGYEAFNQCSGLTGVTIPQGVTQIAYSAFEECGALASVIIPDSVTVIGNWAFCNCKSLANLTIPDSVTRIGDAAFFGCDSLTSMTIPESVTSMGLNPFLSCTLTSVNVSPNNPVYAHDDGVLFDKQQKILVSYPGAKEGVYSIPEGVLAIGESAFSDCSGLVGVTIPNSVTSIGFCAFNNCDGLNSVLIPDSVTNIDGDAFGDCGALTSVVIPDSVTRIVKTAFKGSDNVTLSVMPGSFAERYAEENNIPYVFATK